MRVGIIGYALGTGGGGIEVYVRNLAQALAAVDPGGDYTLFLDRDLPAGTLPPMRRVVVPPGRLRFALSRTLRRERIDVVHVQTAAPLLFPSRIVATVHDLAFERYPRFFSAEVLRKLRLSVPLTVRRAAAVVTDSESSKRDIVRRYRVPPGKVTVAHLAADPIFGPLHDRARLADVRVRYGTGDRFILFTGDALQLRKNVRTLIEAYTRLRRADAIRHRLVLTGPKIWLEHEAFAAARASGVADAMVFTGRVPDADLVALYNAADLFVYPSLYEGFGLPPLEAMACGTPVVTSNASALPEVVGDAALTVDPLDVEGLAGAIAAVLSDADLAARLAARGRDRALTFSWHTTARTVRNTYASVERLGNAGIANRG